jgi:SAM-dependent methyltransferase
MFDYYRRVAEYFDQDAPEFDERYWRNTVLQRIRQAFREEVKRHRFTAALELGCGTGLDLCHFGRLYPDRQFFGLDVAPRMVQLAWAKIAEQRLSNASVAEGSVEQIEQRFPGVRFDLVYVFFGALNTVHSLSTAADILYGVTSPGGVLVLTVVNRWYLPEMLIDIVRGRARRSPRRFDPIWGGYSPTRHLDTRCYSPRDIAAAFGREGTLVRRRGYSILYPAWYRAHWLSRLRRVASWLWEMDSFINRTPLWSVGEYALYVYRRRAQT